MYLREFSSHKNGSTLWTKLMRRGFIWDYFWVVWTWIIRTTARKPRQCFTKFLELEATSPTWMASLIWSDMIKVGSTGSTLEEPNSKIWGTIWNIWNVGISLESRLEAKLTKDFRKNHSNFYNFDQFLFNFYHLLWLTFKVLFVCL